MVNLDLWNVDDPNGSTFTFIIEDDGTFPSHEPASSLLIRLGIGALAEKIHQILSTHLLVAIVRNKILTPSKRRKKRVETDTRNMLVPEDFTLGLLLQQAGGVSGVVLEGYEMKSWDPTATVLHFNIDDVRTVKSLG